MSQAAIVENERPGGVLAFVKERQDERPPPRVLSNSEKGGHRRTGRRPGGRPRLVDRAVARRAGEPATTPAPGRG